ncbi:MAG: histidine triad nucleotide-binding protein [Tissierellales bacterium]
MSECIFCKIASGDIQANVTYEDDKIIAFKDSNPQSPIHVLIIPKEHIPSANYIDENNSDIIGEIFVLINKIAKEMGLDKQGYRIVNNCGEFGGQSVDHIHFHLLGGRQLQWPPG